MLKAHRFALSVLAVSLLNLISGQKLLPAKDKDYKPEEIVSENLKSIGTPAALAAIKNRGVSGNSTVDFLQGGTGKLAGQSLLISAGPNLGFIMRFGGVDYPGEYFAYDGAEVTVSNITPGQRSPLGDFIYRQNGLIKEGLLGGVLSQGWALLNLEQKKPVLRSDRAKIDGRDLLELNYFPKEGLIGMKIKLFFDPETFRHVRTEYRMTVQGEQSLQAGQTITRGSADSMALGRGGASGAITRAAGIQDAVSNSIYVLTEKFDNFKEENGLMLPHTYAITYSVEGHGSSFLANYTMNATQFIQNGKIDSSFFKAR
jgi:hypothetical protein